VSAVVARYRSVLSAPGSVPLFASGLFARLPQGTASLGSLA
jgi:hypothetical protein